MSNQHKFDMTLMDLDVHVCNLILCLLRHSPEVSFSIICCVAL